MTKKYNVGLIINTFGIKGEVKVYPLTDYKERFEELDYVYIDEPNKQKLFINKVKYKNNLVILSFEGLNKIDDVEKFKNKYIYILEEDLRELPEDTYYITDLLGSKVFWDDTYLGILTDVIQNAAQDVYVVSLDKNLKTNNKTALIPAVKEFIKEIDVNNKTVKVKLIEGMIE